MDRIYLHVSPEEYAAVERAGALWDTQSKRWYALNPGNKDLAPWIDSEIPEELFDIHSDEAFVACVEIQCFDCGQETEVVCLFGDRGTDTHTGQEIERFTVSNLSAVDGLLGSQLKRWPNYQLNAGVFVNRCARCDGLLEDYRLHSEPGDAFFGISRESSKHIEFIPLPGAAQMQGDYSLQL